ncbi:MAG: amidohydrolase [Armatimonadetes bacterium CG_4_8_14_3_um_filter_58_9]|nr:MAG: amidohydrolase [Armatimonadetes bacterium CG_4_8_14_3_um_filter_58_9]
MNDIPIIDTHVHLWDTNHLDYPWLQNNALLNKPHLPSDFAAHTKGVNVAQIVFVECAADDSQKRQETDWVTALSEEEPRIGAIVASALVERGDEVRGDLEYLARNPKVKGIRRMPFVLADDGSLDAKFLRGVQLLAEFNLSFDLCLSYTQLENAIEVVRKCPEVTFILDHIGNPNIRENIFDPCSNDIRTLSQLPNVFCKISSVPTHANHKNWTADDIKPFVDHVLQCFGFDRVVFASDWPVCLRATTYQRWVETLVDIVSGCSEAERHKLFYANAEAVYRMGG